MGALKHVIDCRCFEVGCMFDPLCISLRKDEVIEKLQNVLNNLIDTGSEIEAVVPANSGYRLGPDHVSEDKKYWWDWPIATMQFHTKHMREFIDALEEARKLRDQLDEERNN
jgi:hypothetical protein